MKMKFEDNFVEMLKETENRMQFVRRITPVLERNILNLLEEERVNLEEETEEEGMKQRERIWCKCPNQQRGDTISLKSFCWGTI
jgi:hypothetical protein